MPLSDLGLALLGLVLGSFCIPLGSVAPGNNSKGDACAPALIVGLSSSLPASLHSSLPTFIL